MGARRNHTGCTEKRIGFDYCDHRNEEGDLDTSGHCVHSHHDHDRHRNDHENDLCDNESRDRHDGYRDRRLDDDNRDHGQDCGHEIDHLEDNYPMLVERSQWMRNKNMTWTLQLT